MILTKATAIDRNGANAFSWSGLRQFQHVGSTTDLMMKLHGFGRTHKQNVRKQAEQLKYCIEQAIEFKEAASHVSSATKPLLLYYSIMSLALAQVLMRGDGNVSLDKSREKNPHHGLLFNALPLPKDTNDLRELATKLVAKPAFSGDRRYGTFELWHAQSRHDPITADVVKQHENFTTTTSRSKIILVPDDSRLPLLHKRGVNFFDCLINSPSMAEPLVRYGILSKIVKANVSLTVSSANDLSYNFVIHPHLEDVLKSVADNFKFHPSMYDNVSVTEFNSGFGLQIRIGNGSEEQFSVPSSTMWNSTQIRFYQADSPLNEFGFLYVGLYILGNYARYYPDFWMKHVESRSSLALVSGDFMDMAVWRMAQCTFSELTRTYHVCEAG